MFLTLNDNAFYLAASAGKKPRRITTSLSNTQQLRNRFSASNEAIHGRKQEDNMPMFTLESIFGLLKSSELFAKRKRMVIIKTNSNIIVF